LSWLGRPPWATDPALLGAKDALTAHGGHVLNYFGRFMTEEFSRWRGTEPDLPDHLRR
jgi:hypothetical protein